MIEKNNASHCIRCGKPITYPEKMNYGFLCCVCEHEFLSFKKEIDQHLHQSKKIKINGTEYNLIHFKDEWVFPLIGSYSNGLGCPPALLLYTVCEGLLEYYCDITVNIPEARRNVGCQFIDTESNDISVLYWLEQNQFGKCTGRVFQSGFSFFPEFEFYSGEKFREYKRICDVLNLY